MMRPAVYISSPAARSFRHTEKSNADDALAALALLDTLICEFPFVDDRAKAVHIRPC